MKEYFRLQYLIITREFKELGINPLAGSILMLAAFFLLSGFLFHRTEFAKYLLILICVSLLLKLSEKNRTDFILSTFGHKRKRQIRVVENSMLTIPFVFVLIYQNAYYESITLFLTGIALALFSYQSNFNFALPTPFSKRPFEFTVGFRKTMLLFALAYTLTFLAIWVANFNLGIFSMMLVFITSMSFYSQPENEYYVWIYSKNPRSFIFKKMSQATINVFILNVPIILTLLFFYFSDFIWTLAFFGIGLLFLWTTILAKYSKFPQKMHLPEAILIVFCIYVPPALLAILPFFYIKSINKLKLLLHDTN